MGVPTAMARQRLYAQGLTCQGVERAQKKGIAVASPQFQSCARSTSRARKLDTSSPDRRLFLPARGLRVCAPVRAPTKIHECPLPRVRVDKDDESREEKKLVGHPKLRLCAQRQARKPMVERVLTAPHHAGIAIIACLFTA